MAVNRILHKVKLSPTEEQRDFLQHTADLCSVIYETEVERWRAGGSPKPALWGDRRADFNRRKKEFPREIKQGIDIVPYKATAWVFSELFMRETMAGGVGSGYVPRDTFGLEWDDCYLVQNQIKIPKCPDWIIMEQAVKQDIYGFITYATFFKENHEWWVEISMDMNKKVGKQRSAAAMKWVHR